MKTVELYARVRHAVLIEGLSERAAADRFGINARTVSKMLKFSAPPGYVRTRPPFRPKLDAFTGVIDAILAADKDRPKKQRHTSKRIFERLRDEHGFTGRITIVKDYVAGWRQRTQEMFVPLVHPPGHAQVDFGEAIGVIGGVERKIHFLAMDLPHSDAIFVAAYPAETTEAFCDGHVRAFAFFGGVPKSILYDNTKIAGRAFSAMASASGRACSASCNRTTCSRIGSAVPAKATTRGRLRGSSAMHAGTSSCRSPCSLTSRR
jgi:transposase